MKLQQRIFSVAAFAVGLLLLPVANTFAQIYSYFTNTIENAPYQELPTDRVVLPAEDFRDPLNSSILDPDDGFYYNPVTQEFGIELPFEFEFDGQRYTRIQVNVNGFVQVGDLPAVFGTNDPNNMFSKNSPNGVIAPFWGDHYYRTPSDVGFMPSEISYYISGQPGSRVLTIQWKNLNVNYFFDPTDPNNPNAANPAPQPSSIANFQVKIYESPAVGEPKTGDQGNIEFHYGIIGGIPGITKISGSAVGLESVSLTQGGNTSFMNGLFIEDSTSSAYIPGYDGQDSVIKSQRLTSIWPPSRANNNIIVFIATPKPGIAGWGDGDANMSQIPGQLHAGLPQNRYVTLNDVLTILRAVAQNQPLDSLMFRQAYHADVNHNGRFWYSSRKLDNSGDSLDQDGNLVVYRREWPVKSAGVYDDLPADDSRNNLYFQANEYDAALILNYIAGKVPDLPWLLDTIPGYGKAAAVMRATTIEFGTAEAIGNGMVSIPVRLNGYVHSTVGFTFTVSNATIEEFVGVAGRDQRLYTQWSGNRVAVAGTGDFAPGIVGYLIIRPAGSTVTISDLRFNDVQRKGTTLMIANAGMEQAAIQIFPNPFVNEVQMRYVAPETGHYTVQIVNELGQKLRTLWDGHLEAGQMQQLRWDGKDGSGNPVATGIYFWQIVQDGQVVGTYQVAKR